jgi:hypothetical protein
VGTKLIKAKFTDFTDADSQEEAGLYVIGHADRILFIGQSGNLPYRIRTYVRGSLALRMKTELEDPVRLEDCWMIIIPEAVCDLAYPHHPAMNRSFGMYFENTKTIVSQALQGALTEVTE